MCIFYHTSDFCVEKNSKQFIGESLFMTSQIELPFTALSKILLVH